ncbi:MAG: hypothetical protein ACOYMS_06170 [Terrimicrobiaceae bacterium]
MGKILVFASIAISLATAGLGFVNKGKLTETKDTLATTEANLTKTTGDLTKTKDVLKTTEGNLATVTSEKAAAEAQVSGLQTAVETAKSEAAKVTAEKTALTDQVTQITADLEKAKADLAAAQTAAGGQTAVSPDADAAAKRQELETLVAKLQSDLDSARGQVEVFQKERQDRAMKVAKKGLEGRILAVNPAWNFVVLNLGDKNGVVNNTELLVKRGTQLLGKVRVTSVEPSTSIADIVANSVPQGTTISPGDNVIFQTVEE